MDPESGLDAVRHVGIRGGTIEAISETPLAGHARHRCGGLVVAPGFIDLHEHGQQEESYRMMVRDGVTSRLRTRGRHRRRRGVVRGARKAGQIVNYGVAIGHIPGAHEGPRRSGHRACCRRASAAAARPPTRRWQTMEAILREGPRARAPWRWVRQRLHAGRADVRDRAHVPRRGRGRRRAHIHMRGGVPGPARNHRGRRRPHARRCTSSTSTRRPATRSDQFLALHKAARDAGQDVTTEAYPYGAGMTEIQSALFDDWATWPDERFAQHQLVSHRRTADAQDVRAGAQDRRHRHHPRPIGGSRRARRSPARCR